MSACEVPAAKWNLFLKSENLLPNGERKMVSLNFAQYQSNLADLSAIWRQRFRLLFSLLFSFFVCMRLANGPPFPRPETDNKINAFIFTLSTGRAIKLKKNLKKD